MNIADLAIRNGTLTGALCVAILIPGWLSFASLPRQPDPRLTVREARVITPYPGTSAAQVEREVSDKIEQAARGLGQLRRSESYSSRGLSVVRVIIRSEYDASQLPQVWDELRRRIGGVQSELPPGAGPSIVESDLGDRGDDYYALTGKGFSQAELIRVAGLLQDELSTLDGIGQVALFGAPRETIFVEISKAGIQASGVGIEAVLNALGSKNLPADAGRLRIGPEQVAIDPGGLYRSEQDLADLMIAGGGAGSGAGAGAGDRLIRLDDVADISRGYADSPRRRFRVDGAPAIGIALALRTGADPATAEEAVQRRLARLQSLIPLGMELVPISLDPQAAAGIDGMLISLLLALGIVVAAPLLFMGPRAGLVVGFVTLLSMAGTFLVMDHLQLTLDRISMAALIIALGLVTDNAIVILDSIKVRMGRGIAGLQAARATTARYALPTLAGTAVVVLAFAAVGGMGEPSGEYVRALYLVVMIALPISWLAALAIVPLATQRFLKTTEPDAGKKGADGGRFRRLYAAVIRTAVRRRRALLGATALLVALSLHGFGFVKQVFFLAAEAQGFLIEVYFREGTHLEESERQMREISVYLRAHEGVARIATAIGDGPAPFLPADMVALDAGSHYGLSLVFVDDQRGVDEILAWVQADLEERFPDAVVNAKRLDRTFPSPGGRIQLRISGPDPAELRRLADRAKAVIAADPGAKAVRDEWGAKVKVAHPVLVQERVRRLRIDRQRISGALRMAYSGTLTGFYREGSELIPIVARAPQAERDEVEDMADIPVTSPLRGDQVSMLQLVERLDTITEDARRTKRDGLPMISVHADADRDLTFDLLRRIKPGVEKALGVDTAAYRDREQDQGPELEIHSDTIPIRADDMIPLKGGSGYFISWGGEAERAAASLDELGTRAPICFGLILLVTIALFNGLRQPLVVVLMAPLSMIGVTAGLLLTGQPFGFLSLIGVLGLSGILMKNAVLMLDRIDREIGTDPPALTAILQAVTSSLRPTALVTATTILAMLPLLQHDLFRSMAVTIMAGLGVGTLLSLVLAPVLYAVLLRVGQEER